MGIMDKIRSLAGRSEDAVAGAPTAFVTDGKLMAEAIATAPGSAAAPALANPATAAAGAIIAGLTGATGCIPVLVEKLAEDGLIGRAAAWALGRLGAEAALCAAIPGASLDVRDNGYHALAVAAAGGKTGATLPAWLAGQLDAEIDRAKSGGSGLGEKVCRVLAVLGAPGTDEAAQRVIDQDRFCDRFELQRIRKAVAGGSRDRDSVAELTAPWTTIFADQLYVVPAPAPEAPAPKPAPGKPSATVPPPAAGDEAMDPAGEPAAPAPLDWAAFATSPQAATLPPQIKALAAQLGPMLEQLALRGVGAPLQDLAGQEFAGLLLQVLPQALPQQHVQMALSPQALNAYQAMAKWLAASGQATHGDDLATGVKLVREQLKAQMRRTGMLGGPDYSDPDDAPVKPS
jgi:hypothetical protein